MHFYKYSPHRAAVLNGRLKAEEDKEKYKMGIKQ